jgi:hypothetical protein
MRPSDSVPHGGRNKKQSLIRPAAAPGEQNGLQSHGGTYLN